MFLLGKWWHARARRPAGGPISIRIHSIDPEQHFLVQQRMVDTGNEPFAFSRIRAIAAATCFSVAMVSFFGFGSPLLTVFKS
jgi:hypothetical protein